MDFWIDMGIAALLRALLDRKKIVVYAPAFAKVYVKIKLAAESNPTLAAAIKLKESEG